MRIGQSPAKRIMVIYGTRPEAIKLAPVIRAIGDSSRLSPIITLTGQHRTIVDQVNRTFVPHVLPVRVGTWVEFPNSDNVMHQVYSISPAKRFQSPLYVGKPARPIQFDKEGVVAIGCNVHEQMSGFIVVVPTPYFGTAVNGRLTINNLGADDYKVHVWYEGMRKEPEPRVVKLAADGTASLAFMVTK